MSRRTRDSSGELPRVYEGAAALQALLAAAGSPMSVDEVKDLFAEAVLEGASPSEAIPDLFEGEPHFPDPDVARRLYGNLFGLWDRIAAGEREEPRPGRPAKAKPPAAPTPPAPIEGRVLSDTFVEDGFRCLTALPPRERRRLRDRFEQRESAWVEAIHALGISALGEETGLDLAFEVWALCELALGEAVGRTDFAGLRSGAVPEGSQPALARYIDEWLTEAGLDEAEPLPRAERQALEPLLRAGVEQLTRA